MAGKSVDEQAIFEVARKIEDREARQAYLKQMCGEDLALEQQVEALLRAYEENQSFLESPPPELDSSPTLDQPITEKPGTLIGRYKLLEQIGEGGFGVVFMAEQEEPVRRKVALKIIKPGMDTKDVIARFEAERQALAIMDHPNIAKVLDAGATESGRPFFVMELVRGVPITDFCDQNSLTTRERLELFASVCQAVQHAHQKGIIHRDIKPSNVMVTLRDDRPIPKVIDFGVAKATNARLTEQTLFTRFGQMVGTPLYMSPEQAGMSELDIDTRSDIYSLGVLLYELLTGSTPFDQQRIRQAAYDELLKIIREEEPPKPSLRISTLGDTLPSVAAHRKLEPKKLSALVRGELDWIVMKALEKDRTRRYETATGFANDIQRYLNDEAVVACPPSVGYRFRKALRRHRAAVTTSAVILGLLLLFVGSLGWMIRDRLAREHEVARERATQRQIIEESATRAMALSTEYLREGEWDRALAEARRAETVIDRMVVDDQLRNRVAARIADLVCLQRLDELRTAGPGVLNDRESRSLAYSQVFREYGINILSVEPDEAIAEYRKAIELDPDYAKAYDQLGIALTKQSKSDEAITAFRQAIELNPDYFEAYNNLGAVLSRQGKLDEAIEELRKAIERKPSDAEAYKNLAIVLTKQDKLDEAIAECHKAIELEPDFAEAYDQLGIALAKQSKSDEAITAFRQAIELDPDNATNYLNVGICLEKQSKPDQAIREYQRAIEQSEAKPDEQASKYGQALVNRLASAASDWSWSLATAADVSERDPVKAVELANLAIEHQPDVANHWNNLGVAQYRAGDWKAAVEALQKADAMIEEGDRPHRMFLAMAHWRLGDKEKARRLYAQGAAWMTSLTENSEELDRFRVEAEQLMQITEEDRNRLVEEYILRAADGTTETPQANDQEMQPPGQASEKTESEEQATGP